MLESNFGRRFGWYVEREGRRLAALTKPRFTDMFWTSYVIEPLGETPEDRSRVLQSDFWNPRGLTFINRVSGGVAPNAFSSAAGLVGERVVMRALYVDEPSSFERPVLWARRLWRALSRSARYAHKLRMRAALAEIRRRSA